MIGKCEPTIFNPWKLRVGQGCRSLFLRRRQDEDRVGGVVVVEVLRVINRDMLRLLDAGEREVLGAGLFDGAGMIDVKSCRRRRRRFRIVVRGLAGDDDLPRRCVDVGDDAGIG